MRGGRFSCEKPWSAANPIDTATPWLLDGATPVQHDEFPAVKQNPGLIAWLRP
jgi:hypothetical protein